MKFRNWERFCVPTWAVVYSYMQWLLQFRFEVGFELGVGELEAEGMTAPKANVFGPRVAGVVNRDGVTKQHTGYGMVDHF